MSETKKNLSSPFARTTAAYRVGYFLCRIIFIVLRRVKVRGTENIPSSGAFIVAPNHSSWLDPPLVGAASPAPLSYMAKKELFSSPLMGWLLPRINVFPVDRGTSDVGAVRAAFRILGSGLPLLLFPEGTRGKKKTGHATTDRAKKPPKLGVGYFAARFQAPVIPVKIVNAGSFFSFKPMEVIWGTPVAPPAAGLKNDYAAYTLEIIEKIYSLRAGEKQ